MDELSKSLLAICKSSAEESELLDFKREFSPNDKAAFWAETVKDIVAFANSGGGAIVFGVDSDGKNSGIDCSALLTFDNAKILDQVRRYTNSDVRLSVVSVERQGINLPALLVAPEMIPIVFARPGTYEIGGGTQRNAFSVGTIYVRHGSKSEPCNRDDLALFIERRLKAVREEWLGNIRKVVEAEPGAVVVVPSSSPTNGFRLTNDPTAPAIHIPTLSEKYPYRQGEAIKEINKALAGSAIINRHDIQAIKVAENIQHERSPDYIHKPHEKASPQYSREFVELVLSRFNENPDYFKRCRTAWHRPNYPLE